MRVPWVPAGLGSDCGPSCLAMVLSHLGRDTSVEEIRGLLGTGRDGTSAYDLITAARALGLRAEGLRAESWAAAATLRLPAIVHYHRGHFVVLEQISRDGNARIVDPLEGRQRLPRTELERLASGVILTFEPGPDFERRRQRIGWRFIRSTLSGEPAALGRLIAVSLALQATAFAMPAAVAYVVDHLVGDEAPGFLTLVLAGVPVLILAQLATGMLRGRFMAGLVARTSRRWLDELFQHLLRLPLRFFQGRSVEDLLVRIQGSEQVIESLLDEVSTAVLDTLLALTALIAVWAMYPRLSGLVLAVGLVQAVITWFARRQTLDEWMQDILVHSRLYSFASEALGGIAELKIAGLEQIAPTWGTHLDERIRAGARRRRRTAAWDALQQSTQTAGPLLVLAAGAGLAGRGEISIGAVVGFYSLAGVCLAPLGRLATGIYRFQTTLQYLRRAREILDLPIETEGGQAAPPRLGGRLTLAGVCFSHAPLAPPVLTGIDLEIPPGSTTVVLGRSGVGKSTLARILATLLEPTAGRLRVDGIQLEQLRRDQLRARIGIVFQESFLLADSIARNIAFGREVADEQIRRAADLACLLEDLRLMPMGFATPVGSLGHHLSGGQRQRLCLARALAGDPDILILDEGTSAVDLATERQIIANLATLGCTRILFTHRLHVAPLADQVVVLEAGRIVDRGHHAELLDRCRLYAEMWADVEPEQPQEPVLQHQQPA